MLTWLKKQPPAVLVMLVIMVVLAFLLLACCSCAGLGALTDDGKQEVTTTVATTTTKKPVVKKPAPKPIPKPAPKPAPAPKQWIAVAQLSGNSNKQSDIFELKKAKTKLEYNVTADNDMPVALIYVMDEGVDLETSGGFAAVHIDKIGTDSTFLTKSPGKYYIVVKSANCDWSLTIWQEL